MKNTLTLFFTFFLFCFYGYGQNKTELKNKVTQMYKYTVNEDYESLMDLTYPKLFELVPKNALVESFMSSMDNEDFTITVLEAEPNFDFGEIKEIEGNYYSLIKHNLKMKLSYKKPISSEELDEMVGLFKIAMDTDDVKIDKNSIIIGKRSAIIAMSEKEYAYKWYFINNDSNSLFMDALLPKNIQIALGIKEKS